MVYTSISIINILIVLFLAIRIFINKKSPTTFSIRIGFAAVVFLSTLLVFLNNNATNTTFEYITVVIGAVCVILILYDAFTAKKK
ncbi:hypothetical protein [Oceanobacillus neutriphilus]|uniref:hypothetical protein n=1 Tax=Oceanobacillus neutriphilus TaxID=531815 RepID=UPI001668597B|nr:hypothetical protein [Oceanobacillus neutriphilus]